LNFEFITFMSTSTIFLIILIVFLSFALAMGQYYFGKKQQNWGVFIFLRSITYASLLLLLINPKIRHQSFSIEKPSLVLAVDNSRSIKEFQQENEVVDFVENLKNNKKLNDKFEVETYSFGENFERRDTFNFSENQTHISAVFSNLKKIYPSQTAPTILISDGNQTMGRGYEFEAMDFSQPIFPVVVGDTTSYEDLKIDRLNVNRYAFLNNKFPVEIFVSYNGDKNFSQKLNIKQGNHTLFSKTIDFDKNNSAEIIQAELEAKNVGVHTYEAVIENLPKEKNTENNQQKFAVEVIDQQTNVLVLSSYKHPDLGAFKKAIESNQQRSVDIKYIDEELSFEKYQLVILYQPNSQFKSAFEKIKDLEMNYFLITGTKTDYNFLNQQQDFFQKEITTQTEEFLPTYNGNYVNFQLKDIGFNDFPPLFDQFGDIKLKTEQQILLYQNIEGYQTDAPLLSTVEKENRKFGFLFGENFWQWRGKAYRDQNNFKDFDDFTGKLIQYLASNKRKERLNLDYKSFYNSGEKIIFQAYYFDETYEFDPRAKISAQIIHKESKQTRTIPFLLRNNRYELNLSNLEAGEYDFKVEAENKNISKSGEFTIIEFDIEKQFLNANYQKLNKIADKSVFFIEEEEKLINDLINNDNFKPIQKSNTTTSPLIDWWYLLIIIVASLSIEWFMRKYRGMI